MPRTTMEDVAVRLNALRIKEGLDDASWVCSLDEFDEPSLFSRLSRDHEELLRVYVGFSDPRAFKTLPDYSVVVAR